MQLEVRQSKKMVVLGVISAAIFEALFLTFAIWFLIESLKKPYTSDEFMNYILASVFSFAFAVVILIIAIYILYVFFRQTDFYTENKMYRQMGNKIIFEIPYENIINIKQGYDSVFFILKMPIKRLNGKVGPRNFYEHYSKNDIGIIVKTINNFAYKKLIFKNGGFN